MRWTPGGVSPNVEDRRSGFGGGGGMKLGLGGLILAGILSLIFGQDFFSILGLFSGGESAPVAESNRSRTGDPAVQFVSFVLDDAQGTWRRILPSYQDAKLVLFREAVQSGCGTADSSTGPFYCPLDQKVYLDLTFFEELRRRFEAPGDFAQAYVIAHELGHHVQTLLGVSSKVSQAQRANPQQANALSVRLELQADCLAGVWGHSTRSRGILENGDVEEGLNAAAAIGDDRIQRSVRGRINPESFTHGSSEQRVRWFRQGLESGQVEACDTFNTRGL